MTEPLSDPAFTPRTLWEVGLILFFTLLALGGWYLLLRRLARGEASLRRGLLKAFWQQASPVALAVIGIVSASLLLDVAARRLLPELLPWIAPLRACALALAVLWGAFRYIDASERIHVEAGHDATSANAVAKLTKASVLLVVFLGVGQQFGLSLSGLLAFGGAGGLIIGLAGKDILSNFFGGLMIFLDRPFKVGDWISSPDRNIEGTVEHIGWRLTRIFTFQNRPLYVPNSVFSTIAVENPQRMSNRRITTTVGLRYEDSARVAPVVADIHAMLAAHPEIDQTQSLLVNFNAFGESSLNIMVYCYTRTTDWAKWLSVQQEVLLAMVDIVHRHGADFAFPSRTLFIETDAAPRA